MIAAHLRGLSETATTVAAQLVDQIGSIADATYECLQAGGKLLYCGRPGDILFLHSTSGESPNLLRAAEAARAAGVKTIALLARGGGRLAGMVDVALIIPTDNGAHAQELHLAVSHIICDLVEQRFVGK